MDLRGKGCEFLNGI